MQNSAWTPKVSLNDNRWPSGQRLSAGTVTLNGNSPFSTTGLNQIINALNQLLGTNLPQVIPNVTVLNKVLFDTITAAANAAITFLGVSRPTVTTPRYLSRTYIQQLRDALTDSIREPDNIISGVTTRVYDAGGIIPPININIYQEGNAEIGGIATADGISTGVSVSRGGYAFTLPVDAPVYWALNTLSYRNANLGPQTWNPTIGIYEVSDSNWNAHLNGVRLATYTPTNAFNETDHKDVSLGILPAGSHKIYIVIDGDEALASEAVFNSSNGPLVAINVDTVRSESGAFLLQGLYYKA